MLTKSGQADVEITPEMIAAGIREYRKQEERWADDTDSVPNDFQVADAVARIYSSMRRCRL